MANTTISPNMNMPVPTVAVDPGPDWATNVDASLSIVDSHDHTPGKGVQITPNGININADLPMSNNNLTTVRSVRFFPQGSPLALPADLGCLYESGVDLFYNDGSGNQVRITQSGAVSGASGTITGLPSGTASASFAGTTFAFQSATNTPASMNVGPVDIRQAVANGKGVTISANGAQPANFNLFLPTALPPDTQSSLVSDTSGNMSFVRFVGTTYSPTVTWSFAVTTIDSTWYYTVLGTLVTVIGQNRVTILTNGTTFSSVTLPISLTTGLSIAGTIAAKVDGSGFVGISTIDASGATLAVPRQTIGTYSSGDVVTLVFNFTYGAF